jgi:uncharacterized membrane protein
MHGLLFAATLVTALGCGLVAGVFFAFSSFVMPALARLTSAYHVPRNDALDTVDAEDPAAAGHWTRYLAPRPLSAPSPRARARGASPRAARSRAPG